MDRSTASASQTRYRLELPTTAFPFRRELSLAPLVAAWERAAAEPGIAGDVARTVCRGLETAPGAPGADRRSWRCSIATASWSRS